MRFWFGHSAWIVLVLHDVEIALARVLRTEYLALPYRLKIPVERCRRYPLGRSIALHDGFNSQDMRQEIVVCLVSVLKNIGGIMKILRCCYLSIRKQLPRLYTPHSIAAIYVRRIR